MASITAIVKNLRPLDGRAYVALIGLAILMNYRPGLEGAAAVSFLAGVLFVWYSFSINNCFDVDTDSKNPRKLHKNPVASGELTFREGIVTSLSLSLLGTLLAYTLSWPSFVVYLSMVFLATVYSAPPRLKARPALDVLVHGLFFGFLPFVYGSLVDGTLSKNELLIAAAVGLYSFSLELRNHLEDYESDLSAGLRTTPAVIGKRRSETLVAVFSGLTLVLLLAALNPVLGLVGGAFYGFRDNYRLSDAAVVVLLVFHALGAVV
ncbi:4-hydroxybenzoate polyprenyltransferase [Thermococcus sp. M36]|uniref:UbiA prenyltransferase family protein n=1 Tax=Thermococcus sp. M36 TaxID=1638261 RepID=UPI001439BEB5|nr:UbiA prenyltransferase family protein [Thermococcus sp. M36]NJE05207.1 4-hydroxybenzoate polyprenyltransferase [Thermococcus sp. M36]